MDAGMNWAKISLAIWGEGRLKPRFVDAVGRHYRGIAIYDREEEKNRPPSDAPIPAHPEVADIDAVFVSSGRLETLTIKSIAGHRCFNYEPEFVLAGQTRRDILLRQVLQGIQDLLSPPQAVAQPTGEQEQ